MDPLISRCAFCGVAFYLQHRPECPRNFVNVADTPASVQMVSSNDNGGPILLDTLDADGGPLALAPRNDKGEPIISDGGSSAYYVFPDGASELNDLIEHRQMSFARGNIFKALYRLGEKAGVDVEYDLNKMELFLARLRKMHREGKSI